MKKVDARGFLKALVAGDAVVYDTNAPTQELEPIDIKKYGNASFENNKYSNYHPGDAGLRNKILDQEKVTFEVSGMEKYNFNKFYSEHNLTCEYMKNCFKTGAVGQNLRFIFVPNSIGMSTYLECACGTRLDLTDYECW